MVDRLPKQSSEQATIESNYESVSAAYFSLSNRDKQEQYALTQTSDRKVTQRHNLDPLPYTEWLVNEDSLMLRCKTILVTDAVSKLSLAITFKGNPIKSN